MKNQFDKIPQIKMSLRSINNCFRVPNLFLNKNQSNLTKNIEFIPKHIRRKIVEKQQLNCKDIMELEFKPQRQKVDLITVRTAVKIQQKYRNILEERDKKVKIKKIEHKQFSNLKDNQLKEQAMDELNKTMNHNFNQMVDYQCMKLQIPTQKELNKQIGEEPQQIQN